MRSRRLTTAAALALALAGTALLAAGCGGGSPPSAVANIGTTADTTTSSSSSQAPVTAQSKKDAIFAFSKCMRANGVPNFPDPQTTSHGFSLGIDRSSGIDPSSPAFKAAQKNCQKLLPNGGAPSAAQQHKMEQQALAYSACMRKHGVPNFPDPQFDTSGGGFGIRIRVGGNGLDPTSPAFKAAQNACQGIMPGAVKGSKAGP